MSHLTKTLSDRHRQEQPSSHHHQPTRWPLKRTLLQPPRPKHLLLQRQELQHKPLQPEPRQQMYYKAYKERLEGLSQEELQEEVEEAEEEQDLRGAEHHLQLPMLPNNRHNLLKMSK